MRLQPSVWSRALEAYPRRLYEAAGFRRTEGEGGSAMLAYEREL